MNWMAVFFDFDGVILDSVHVKTKAFAKMFEKYGAKVKADVVKYHLDNGGVFRMDKFKYFYKHFLKEELSEKSLNQLCFEFSGLVVEKVVASEFILGALESLNVVKEKGIPAFVVSGTPQDEMELIALRKGLADYFIEIHGSPRKKDDIVRDILERKSYNPSKCLFIGDSMSDYDAALANNMQFLGIVASDNESSTFPFGTNISHKVKF